VEALKERDPIPRLAASLREWGVLDDAGEEALKAEVKTLIAESAARAEARPEPDATTILRHVYADGS
jgi:2-oxoisovalerate dehydrogenase E1 component alpha subunit